MIGKSIVLACMMCAASGFAAEKLFDGETIIFLKTKTVAASTVIVTKNKKLIVIDGGYPPVFRNEAPHKISLILFRNQVI